MGHDRLFPRGAPWSDNPIATEPDSTNMENQDHLDLGNQRIALVPVLQLPMLHMEGQTSVVILRMITMVPSCAIRRT